MSIVEPCRRSGETLLRPSSSICNASATWRVVVVRIVIPLLSFCATEVERRNLFTCDNQAIAHRWQNPGVPMRRSLCHPRFSSVRPSQYSWHLMTLLWIRRISCEHRGFAYVGVWLGTEHAGNFLRKTYGHTRNDSQELDAQTTHSHRGVTIYPPKTRRRRGC